MEEDLLRGWFLGGKLQRPSFFQEAEIVWEVQTSSLQYDVDCLRDKIQRYVFLLAFFYWPRLADVWPLQWCVSHHNTWKRSQEPKEVVKAIQISHSMTTAQGPTFSLSVLLDFNSDIH